MNNANSSLGASTKLLNNGLKIKIKLKICEREP